MIGFVGLSHLGTVSSISIASRGFDVLAYDPNPEVVAGLNKGRPPVHEPELDDLLAKNVGKKIHFTANADDLKKCDVVYFALDVKTSDENVSDLAPLTALIEKTVPHLAKDATLVLLSQVPPGYSRPLAARLKQTLYYQVETLIFGRAVERAVHPERYIVGCLNPEAPLPEAYAKLLKAFDCPILPMRFESAELAKISINMCLVSSIAVANTLAEICENIGAEWNEIAGALKLDRRIGQYSYLSPGLGIAGGNLERDLVAVCTMAREHGTDAGVVEAWIANNEYRLRWVLRTLSSEVFANKPEAKLGVWGLAYKQDTHSTKNSPSLATLQALPSIPVLAYDPQVVLTAEQRSEKLTQVSSALEACKGVDALMVLTPWREFSTTDLKQVRSLMAGDTLLDPYGVLDAKVCRELGFNHLKLGSAPQSKGFKSC